MLSDLEKERDEEEERKNKGRRVNSTFTCIHVADAFVQSDFQERALQKCIDHCRGSRGRMKDHKSRVGQESCRCRRRMQG